MFSLTFFESAPASTTLGVSSARRPHSLASTLHRIERPSGQVGTGHIVEPAFPFLESGEGRAPLLSGGLPVQVAGRGQASPRTLMFSSRPPGSNFHSPCFSLDLPNLPPTKGSIYNIRTYYVSDQIPA